MTVCRLDGKVAVITGSSVSIGEATARLFARGVHSDQHFPALLREQGRRSRVHVCCRPRTRQVRHPGEHYSPEQHLDARGAQVLRRQSRSIGHLPRPSTAGGVLNILDIPFIFIIASVMALMIGLVPSRAVFGQKIYLTGSNPQAVLFSSINVGG
jgi:hypothetical protein